MAKRQWLRDWERAAARHAVLQQRFGSAEFTTPMEKTAAGPVEKAIAGSLRQRRQARGAVKREARWRGRRAGACSGENAGRRHGEDGRAWSQAHDTTMSFFFFSFY
jgi:hypothetical protein